ncbi:MAG: hypothetical protein ACJ0P5_02845 [Flavobacteriaceae bacterium]|tara:strand:- start:333 stop:743 length:411 start_codon:yes stop_codon:yes gene_type:complete
MKKIIITVLISFISSIVIGILPAILFYIPSQIEFAKLFPSIVNEEPEPIFMLLGSLALLILWVVSFDKMGIKDYRKGALTGIWYSLLCFIFFDFTVSGLTNIYSMEFIITDILLSGIIGGPQGAIIGWSLGRFAGK